LLEQIHRLVDGRKASVTPDLQPELIAEANRQRGNYRSNILKPKQIEAAKRLRNMGNITVRKADKAAMLVLIPTDEYLQKIDSILADESKFKKISRDPTLTTTRKANKIIEAINAVVGNAKLPKIVGDYRPGYLYGNVKTHKRGNPLRPIISQIPTPTYNLAKKLNGILSPHIPKENCFESSRNFLDAINSAPEGGVISSLDVESLFTNVPVERTINYICEHIYRSDDHPLLDIPEAHLRTLLKICTQESAFRCPRGNLYLQVDGVAMGSPLGVLFANFFMGSVEKEVFDEVDRPLVYGRYVDDIFIKTNTPEEREALRRKFEQVSGLRFTTEEDNQGSLPFLDVLVKQDNEGRVSTSVYTKPTNPGLCLNGESECPQRYKDTTIAAFFRRALTHCSSWAATVKEFDRVCQLLVNNGHSNHDCKRVKQRILSKWREQQQQQQQQATEEGEEVELKLFYKAFMSTAYKEEEKAIKSIVSRNVKPNNDNNKIKLIIYYKSRKTKDLLMKNDNAPEPRKFDQVNVVYRFSCPHEDCTPHSTYIGMTTTKLSRRLSYHLNSGGPKRHMLNHGISINRNILEENTSPLEH
ncbi:MAG: reverse transcriptase domain-containing protein, partial [Cyanobacteria bacterium J06614_10]